jgi:primosomal protein N'
MFKEILTEQKLTKAQQKVLDLLSDGEWHNMYNKGIKGLKLQTLEALIKKGLVEFKKDVDRNRETEKFGTQYEEHPDRDWFYRIKNL